MDSAVLYLVTAKETANVSVNLENMPVIEKNITEENKKDIAYEVLKRMKERKLIRFFVYTQDSTNEDMPDRTIDLV